MTIAIDAPGQGPHALSSPPSPFPTSSRGGADAPDGTSDRARIGPTIPTAGRGMAAAVSVALDRAVAALLDKQHDDRPWGATGTESGRGVSAGHWCAELEGDSILSSEYLLMKWILGQEEGDAPGAGGAHRGAGRPTRDDLHLLANHLRMTQGLHARVDVGGHPPSPSEGTSLAGWGQYPGSPVDLSATVKAYFALKLMGDPPAAAHMRAARDLVLSMGGAENINTFSMFYLACLGQVSWDACPAIPAQIVLLPRCSPFHLDKVAAWTRTMILPLAICAATRPVRRLPAGLGIDELFVSHHARSRLNKRIDRGEPLNWSNAFLVIDRLLKLAARAGVMPLQEYSKRLAERWLVERMNPETTEGLGAIFPPMVYAQIALKSLGYERWHPVIRDAEAQLDAFIVRPPVPPASTVPTEPARAHLRIQPCFSPVWDTGIALYALTETGLNIGNSAEVRVCCRWLLDRQVRRNGDWVRNLRPEDRGIQLGVDGAAWAFEYRNDWYPDVDDTAMAAKALWRAADRVARHGASSGRDDAAGLDRLAGECRRTARLAARWMLAMQNDDGGWAAFDRTKDRPWMEAVPFADHNAMQDPSCADITGRVLEALITCGVARESEAVRSAVRYVLGHQQPEGCWWGRWGVNYVYGTWQAVGGLSYAMGRSGDASVFHPSLRRTLEWLRCVQNADGGFGETANTYLDRSLMGRGPSTASQTAWGLLSLMYLVSPTDESARRAAAWLCDHQLASEKVPHEPAWTDGNIHDPGTTQLAAFDFSLADHAGGWSEHFFTGTGFPKVFYLRYHLYRHYFPVMALGRYRRLACAIA
ncbi:MAG: squalene--hopene cyclase [Phycisphaerales bacterium]|nr:squalene--hopene cyclase [Phycisphaerales bacterium]